MANEMATQSPSFGDQKAQEDEECLENIPPAFTSSETCPATPSSNQKDKGKPRLSGLQSALTPILKYLNIGNKSTSPLPVFSFNNGTAKSNESVSVLTLGDKDNPASSVLNENLPEITLLDVTCDSTMNMTRNTQCDSAPSTPVFINKLKKPGQLCPTLTPICWLHDEILPEITLLDDTCDTTVHLTRHGSVHSDSVPGTPTCETPIKPAEMILGINSNSKLSSTLTPKNDTSSVMSEKETPSLENTHDCTPKKRPSSETSEILAKTAKLNQCSQEKMSTTFTGNLTHSINSSSGESDNKTEDVKKVKLQVTQDISLSSTLDGSKTSSENSTQNMDKMQPAVESHPVNITRDLNFSSDMSVQCEGSQSLDSNSKNVTSELQVGLVKTFCPKEETSCNSDLTTKGTNKSTAGSLNSTFTTVQEPSSASSRVSNLQNRTLDFPTSNSGSSPMTEAQKTNISTKLSPETSLVLNDSCSDSKSSQSCEMQNQTFEKNSLQKSSGSTILVQAGTTIKCLQNTFENKPNGTINYTETITSDKPQDTMQENTSSQGNNTTTETLSEMSGDKMQATTDPNVKPAELPESTFDVNPVVEEISGASGSGGEAKDSLNNGHPLCESIIHHNTFTESHKANTFNLDNTFDFKSDPLVTSTPMPTSKAFNFTNEREDGKTAAAQKKLYEKEPSKLGVQVMSEMPSNIVCDRKTFLPQPTTKQNLLTMKPPSLLSKFKPTSLLPKRPDLLTSGLPMTRQVEAVKNKAAVLQQTTEMASSYNLRSTTAAALGLKQPSSGIRKPPLNSIPFGIQRPGHGLKPPVTKASASDKPPGGTHALVKSTQPNKKHPLSKTEALPAAKKKKMDTALPSGNVDAPVSLLDTASKAKTLKPPTHSQRTLPTKTQKHDSTVPATSEITATCGPSSRVRTLKLPATGLKAPTTKLLCHGCTNCSLLEEQLKLKDEEIKHLKEELLKCSKKKDPTSL